MSRFLTVAAVFLLVLACSDTIPTDVSDTEGLVQAAMVDFTPLYNPANGNYYYAVAEPGIIRYPARDAAASLTYRACPGHLATITSQEENDFIADNFPEAVQGRYWLGGREAWDFDNPTTGWGWITGELFQYDNWGVGEPNGVNENHLQFHAEPGAPWNDLDYQSPTDGYVVEFDCGPQGPVVEQVSGSGHFFDPRINDELGWEGDGWRTFSFTARKYADGRVKGEYQFQNRNSETKWHGNVTCFQVRDNKVWIGGFEDTAPEPNSVYWIVVDNGQGSNAEPDQISLRGRRGNMAFGSAHCTYTPEYEPGFLDLYDVESGNIQIK